MNREQVYVEFRKKVESDSEYFNFGKTGLIEEVMAYFGLASAPFKGASSWVHEDNLKTLHDFMMNEEVASDEQVELVRNMVTDRKSIPILNPCSDVSGNVFVSMPMNTERYDCVDAIREGVGKGIVDSGNIPYFLDRDAHNDDICAKMLDEIQNCKFLVADFTRQNPGVYYEAGYAKALGKTVIHTCREDEMTKRHFDIEHMNFVFWKDAEDLHQKLKERIEKSGLGVK